MKPNLSKLFAILVTFLISLTPICSASQSYNLQYDLNGNLIQDKDNFYEYNSLNQLTRIRQNNENGRILEEYDYDNNGDRIKKVSYHEDLSNTITYYINKNFIRVINNSGTYDFIYYYNDGQLIAKQNPDNSKSYYHPDHLGSNNIITDEAGNKIEETTYLPFGDILEGGNDRFTYTGKEKDSTGLMYYGARYYSPFLRRFTQPDTLIQDIYDPQSLNRYAYARNNPLVYKDDSGHFWHIALGMAIGGVIGGGANLIGQVLNGASLFDGSVNWGSVGISAVAGSVFGGVATATFGLGIAAAGTGYGGYALGGAISGLTGGRASQLTSNLITKDNSWNDDLLNVKDIIIETGGGAIFGMAGKAVGSVFGKGKVSSKPNLKSGKVQEFPIKDLYGTHQLSKKYVLAPEKIKLGKSKGPIEIFNYEGKLIINDGMGRTARSKLVYGKDTVSGRISNPSPGDIGGWEYARYLNQRSNQENMIELIGNMK
ncbi:MAG: RHS repeat-associated core domain-containing protein [Candidatus Woesearchaeota archaeon]|jgi:RHS repeat-associated protein|nr:RHS repeat-associated core domain-containing protein [Candidatus Woesearchaeota archaeon]